MRSITIRGVCVLVVDDIDNSCVGCVFNRGKNKACAVHFDDIRALDRADRCGLSNILYIERNRKSVRNYRTERVVRRLSEGDEDTSHIEGE